MGEYGRNLGLAFQIVDDVLDLTAAEDVLGKPVASDLREGKATLAVIHALERGTGADREAIRTVLADRSFERISHPAILEILNRHGSLAYAMDTAHAYAEAARQSIADLPDSDAKRALLWVPTFVTTRDR
jgi:octaprenyl-diphosphate synthase